MYRRPQEEVIMRAADVMTPRVVAVDPEATIAEAADLMLRTGVSGLLVIDNNGALVGIVTEGDLLRRAELGTQRIRPRWLAFFNPGKLAEEYARSHGRNVREVMTVEVETVAEDTHVSKIVKIMTKGHIKRLPVLRDGKVVGIVSRADLMRALCGVAETACLLDPDDSAIRTRILAAVESESWAPTALLNPQVTKGEVDLWGTITDERERAGLRALVENVPGVRTVRDHLVWCNPYCAMVLVAPEEEKQAHAA
jgi:CBS domain-containing protein